MGNNMVYFEHDGHAVHNPTMSECGRFSVSPEYYGFAVYHTGGGCTAWRRELPDGRYMLLTDVEDGLTHVFSDGEAILLGLYDEEGENISYSELTAGAL
jgi:hypothetical protein